MSGNPSYNPKAPGLLPQGSFNSFDTVADAIAGLKYKQSGDEVYIVSEDEYYYWKNDLDGFVKQDLIMGGGGGGSGTVTSVSVVNANGFSATILNASTTPAITLKTTITGLLKGNGTALLAAADTDVTGTLLTGYVSATGSITSADTILTAIEKLNGNISASVTSVAGTTNRITSSGGTTPTIDISSSYVGQTSITTLGTITTGTLSNSVTATLKDSLFTIQDDGDITKQLKFQLSSISTATTRTLTVPDYNGTLVARDSVFRATTTTSNNVATTIQTISTTSNKGYMIEVRVQSRRVSGAGVGVNGDTNAYIRTFKAKNVSGTLTLAANYQSDFTSEDIDIHDVTITTSGTDVLIQVAGSTNNVIDWVAVTEVSEIA